MEGGYSRRDTATMLMSALSDWYQTNAKPKTGRRKFTRLRERKVSCFSGYIRLRFEWFSDFVETEISWECDCLTCFCALRARYKLRIAGCIIF